MTEEQVRRGPKGGPRLKTLLTQTLPYGATMNDLVTAGFRGEIKPYLDGHKVEIDADGRYFWIETPAESTAPTAEPPKPSQTFPAGHRLDVHPLCEMFPVMADLELIELADDIAANGLREPIKLFEGKILDGRNWYTALLHNNAEIPYREFTGTEAETAAYVISKNIWRRHLTQDEKRDRLAQLLRQDPSRSDRAIAELAHTSDKTVAAVRKRLETTAEVSAVEKRKGRDGKARKAPAKRRGYSWRSDPTYDAEFKDIIRKAESPPRIEPPADPITHVPPRPSATDADVGSFDSLSTRIPCRNPKAAAAAIIGKMLRADIQKLVEELQAYLDSPVLQ